MLEFLTELFTKKKVATDIEISWRGQKILKNFVEREVTPRDIFDIQQEQGYDVAAWVLYKSMRDKPKFQNFASFIDEKKERYSPKNKETVVFIMSHNPWTSAKTNNNYQWRLKNIAADVGYECCMPEIPHRRSIFANAYYYQEILKRYAGRKIIFVTHSVASLEMRWFLEKSLETANLDVIGWLNISGLLFGTSLPPSTEDWFVQAKRYFTYQYPVLPEVSRSNSYCYSDLKLPTDFPMVSMVGFNPSKLFTMGDSQKAKELKFWGPNDGYVTLADYLNVQQGVVWPLWNEGHYVDVEIYKTRIQGALNYLTTEAEILRAAIPPRELVLPPGY